MEARAINGTLQYCRDLLANMKADSISVTIVKIIGAF